MENTVYTVVSFDGWQYVFSEKPEYHTEIALAYKEFNKAIFDSGIDYQVALIAYPSATHLQEDKAGEIVLCTMNWHEVSGRWVEIED